MMQGEDKKILCSDGKYRTLGELFAIAKGESLKPFPNALPLREQIKLWFEQSNISNGKIPTKAMTLYTMFCEWCEERCVGFPTLATFGRELKLHLPWKRKNSGMVYWINQD